MEKDTKDIGDMAVVIIGRNEGGRLELCLRSVIDSGVGQYVYVDSLSSDASVEIAAKLGVPTTVLDMGKPLSAARGRNTGFEWIRKLPIEIEYIHFIDGDCELDNKWLEEAKNTLCKTDHVAVVCGRLREKNPTSSVYSKLCDIAWYMKPGEITSCGGITTVRASVFDELKGFDESLIAGEEAEFCNRVANDGHKLVCIDAVMGSHDSAIKEYSQWWIRSIRTGFAFASAEKWGQNNKRRSLVIWGAVYPLLIIFSLLIAPIFTLVLFFILVVQIFRLYMRLNIPYSRKDKLLYSFFCMHDKIPEFLGFLKYRRGKKNGTVHELIEYKTEQGKNGGGK